jgi:hypothetical protein
MSKQPQRIDYKDLTRGQILALVKDHPDTFFLHPSGYLLIKGDQVDFSSYLTKLPFSPEPESTYVNIDGEVPVPPTFDQLLDIPNLTDIESIVYEPYYDTVSKLQKVRAILKIRNSSKNELGVESVDARIFNPNTIVQAITKPSATTSTEFITPTPTVPNVVFQRDGTTISWGWDEASGFGSYSSVSYEWIISTTQSGSALSAGSKQYPSTTKYPIGKSVYTKDYRVSSADRDTAATSAARWLRVRTVVVGKNNQTYYSNYSTPI